MVFSSITFLYYFLPALIIIYFVVPNKFKNLILLLFSMFFYFYGEPRYIIVLLFSCVFNYYYGKIIEKAPRKRKKLLLAINLIVNFGILFYFKYFHFFLDNINALFGTNLSWMNVIMPIGISFFTFQSTSYVIDIYKGEVKSAKNLLTFATYLSLFPQLIAGPIVRYETVDEELEKRTHSFENFAKGVKRFIIGLAKKVLIANVLGEFSKNLSLMASKTVLSYWLKAISDTFQIYFDFSGYSDMAIGLGLLFGFHFLENFNYPLIANSITNFWHRWHISLSSWFKDYVYIPLGGSKKGDLRRYINIFIVWMTTGLWHGASWNFILWGLYFAILLIIEKIFLLNFLKQHKIIGHIYTVFLVIISFIIFNETSISSIVQILKNMFGFGNIPFINIETMYYLKNTWVILLLASIMSTLALKKLGEKVTASKKLSKLISILEIIIYIGLLIIITAYIVDESFNPFLYFRF